MANEDPFKSRSPDIFSVGRSAPRPSPPETAPAGEEQEAAARAADPWAARPAEGEEEAEQERGGNPWDRPSRDSVFSAARPVGSRQSTGSAWTQVRREVPPDDGSTGQSFAVRRYDPRSPREKENPFASKDQPPPPPRRVDNSFGSSPGGSAAPPPQRREREPPLPDNPFTAKPRDNPFASRNKRGR